MRVERVDEKSVRCRLFNHKVESNNVFYLINKLKANRLSLVTDLSCPSLFGIEVGRDWNNKLSYQ